MVYLETMTLIMKRNIKVINSGTFAAFVNSCNETVTSIIGICTLVDTQIQVNELPIHLLGK